MVKKRFSCSFCAYFVLCWLSIAGMFGMVGVQAQTTTVTYTTTTAQFANPERGFYHYQQADSSNPTVWSSAELANYRTNEDITLLYCLFVLDEFRNSPISNAFLNTISNNFAAVRSAGLKCIVRFAYVVTTVDNNNDGNPDTPYGDASKATVLGHIAQLQPVLRANSDVIAVLQAGFIGIWGEWYYTDYFVDNPATPDIVSADRYADRRAVVDALLAALPTERMLAVRTPAQKRTLFANNTNLTLEQAYSGTALARVGFHNDCFLASPSDFGTFDDNNLSADYTYLANETRYTAMGGETCNPNPPRSLCATATEELALFHWSYLNIEYEPDVLNSWRSGGCMDAITRQLGYRFELQEGVFQNAVRPGDALSVQLTLRNTGYAAPYNPRNVVLLLRHNGTVYRARLNNDPRFWLADGTQYTLTHQIKVPDCVAPGNYELLLHLPDSQLASRPEYAIRFANGNVVWEANTGFNRLGHTVTVDSNAPQQPAQNGEPEFVNQTCGASIWQDAFERATP